MHDASISLQSAISEVPPVSSPQQGVICLIYIHIHICICIYIYIYINAFTFFATAS